MEPTRPSTLHKSAKRRAAEALLAARFGVAAAAAAAATPLPPGLLGPTAIHSISMGVACGCVRSLACSSPPSSASGSSDLEDSDDSSTTGAGAHTGAAGRPSAARCASITASLTRFEALPGPAAAQPAAKRPRIDVSAAAATSSLEGSRPPLPTHRTHTTAAAAAGAAPARLTFTTVPPCDPARGCAAAAAAAAAPTSAATAAAETAAATPAGGPSGQASPAGPSEGAASAVAAAAASGGEAGAAGSGSGSASGPSVGWCSFEVRVPSLNWQAVFDEPPASLVRTPLARGYTRLGLPEGLVGYLVEDAAHVEDALVRLRAGMQDRLVSLDLEWRPETVSGRVSPVALLQLSSATTTLLLRCCRWGYAMPAPLAAFLRDPAVVVLGFGWDSADEAKMRSTFGMGRASFRRFVDLQEVAGQLGYRGFGLSRLTGQVLGLHLHKSKHVSRSNWAAPQLSPHQLKYACLDVLAAGQLFRALRLWHSSPSPCDACRQPIGELLPHGLLTCGQPGCTSRPTHSLQGHTSHCAAAGHPPRYAACDSCGRVHEVGATAAAAAAAAAGGSGGGGGEGRGGGGGGQKRPLEVQ